MPNQRKTAFAPPWHYGRKAPVIDLGKDGDDRYIEVCFPIEQAINQYRKLHLFVRPNGGELYEPANTCIVDRHTFLWRPDNADNSRGQAGELAVWMTEGDQHTVVYRALYRIHSDNDQ